MNALAQKVFDEALELQPVDKAELIESLFASFDKANRERIDKLWAVEAESRIDAFEKGRISATDAQDVFNRINAR